MKNKITNPFITSGYIGPDYFCNRTEEFKKLLGAISSRRNLTIRQSDRSTGNRAKYWISIWCTVGIQQHSAIDIRDKAGPCFHVWRISADQQIPGKEYWAYSQICNTIISDNTFYFFRKQPAYAWKYVLIGRQTILSKLGTYVSG